MKIKLLAILIMIMTFIGSCKKESIPLEIVKNNIKAYSGILTQTDYDLSLKGASLNAHRYWSLYRHPLATPTSGVWEYVDGTEFTEGTAAQLYWAAITALPISHVNDIGDPSASFNILYTPDIAVKLVSKTVNTTTNNIEYLAIKNFTPTEDYTLTLKGRELRDVLIADLGQLKGPKGYRFNVTITYKVNNIDVDATALGSDDTDSGYPTLVYSPVGGSTTTVTQNWVFNNKTSAKSYTFNTVPTTATSFTLCDNYDQKISDLKVGWTIEQQSGGSYIAYKTMSPYAINTNVSGIGLNMQFKTSIKNSVTGTAIVTDFDITVINVPISVN